MSIARPVSTDGDFLERWAEAWSCGDPTALREVFTPDARYEDVGSGAAFHGQEEIERFYRWMLRFSPDSRIEFHTLHGDERGFGARWTWSGTAAGPLLLHGELVPTNGASFSVPGIAWCTVAADGRLGSHEDYYDMHAVVRQVAQRPVELALAPA